MVCRRCAERTSRNPRETWRSPARRKRGAAAGGEPRDPRCTRCGAPLTPDAPGEALLDKLVQLAQFGLTAGVGPLLEPSRDSN